MSTIEYICVAFAMASLAGLTFVLLKNKRLQLEVTTLDVTVRSARQEAEDKVNAIRIEADEKVRAIRADADANVLALLLPR